MSREIKFRVWMDGGWVYCSNPSFQPGGFADYGLHFESDREVHYSENIEVIQQFTGLLDKNGREIYEGDIISYPIIGNPFQETKFINKEIKFDDLNGGWTFPAIVFGHPDFSLIEVTGNIFENPELPKP